MSHIPCGLLTAVERTAIYATGDIVLTVTTGNSHLWKYSIGLSGDMACRVAAFALSSYPPLDLRDKLVSRRFNSMADKRSNIAAVLAEHRLPTAVTAATLATAPDFINDAKVAYRTIG